MSVVEVWIGQRLDRVISLVEGSYTVGSDPDQVDIALDDPAVSGVHALLERVASAWLLRDVGSRNGTRLNGERLTGQRRLQIDDEVHVGRTRLVFRDRETVRRRTTDALAAPPGNLTRMERRTLVELCRPLLSHNTFQPPASVREIAGRLFVGKNAVQAHLTSLYDKFGIQGGADRRLALANEAVQRGAVTMADLAEEQTDGASGRG